MYGKKRIVLSDSGAGDGRWRVYQKGGGSSASIGVWYRDAGQYFADLRSAEQEYQAVTSAELGLKRFGGLATKTALRAAIAKHRGVNR